MNILQFIASSNFITLNKTIIKKIGLEEAVILGELASEFDYWTKKNQLENGWFYSTVENMEENTGLSDFKQRKALTKLKDLKIVEIKIKSVPAKRYIRINQESLIELLDIQFFNNLRTRTEEIKELDVKKLKGNNNINNNINNKVVVVVEEKDEISKITKCFEENIGLITPAVANLLFSYLDDNMTSDLICEAINIASINNKRSGNYINGILRDWNKKGYKTKLDLENGEKQKEEERKFLEKLRSKEETQEEKNARKLKELEESLKNDK